MTDWQLIDENTPRNKPIILHGAYYFGEQSTMLARIGEWRNGIWFRENDDLGLNGLTVQCFPTHWMPYNKPPVTRETE